MASTRTARHFVVYRISGERIRDARKRAELTQAQLAERMGVSYQLVSLWENDARVPHANLVFRLAQVLHVSMIGLYQPVEREA